MPDSKSRGQKSLRKELSPRRVGDRSYGNLVHEFPDELRLDLANSGSERVVPTPMPEVESDDERPPQNIAEGLSVGSDHAFHPFPGIAVDPPRP